MSLGKMDAGIDEAFKAIESCIKNAWILPALQLIYTTIDILGWIDSPENPPAHRRGVRFNFCDWVDKYVPTGSAFSSLDLYAARCAVLHQGSPDSNLSDKGEAKRALYCWGSADPAIAQKVIDDAGASSASFVLRVEDLNASLHSGYQSFRTELDTPSQRTLLVIARAAKQYATIHVGNG